MMLVFTVICTLLKMKEQNDEYLDYFSDNEIIDVSMKIFNANCADNWMWSIHDISYIHYLIETLLI